MISQPFLLILFYRFASIEQVTNTWRRSDIDGISPTEVKNLSVLRFFYLFRPGILQGNSTVKYQVAGC